MSQTLYLMLGYPGSGKTTTAKLIAELTGAEHLWADHVRREMYKQPTYSHLENLHLYTHLNDMTDQLLSVGKSVVFDTNFNFYKDRQHLREIASRYKVRTIVVWVNAPKDLAKQRATVDAHLHAHTRVLGHMPVEHFERISENLEPPHDNEDVVEIDGTKVTADYIRTKLESVT